MSALALTTAQAGLADWLLWELVGTAPLSERCAFPGGSCTLTELDEFSSSSNSEKKESSDSSKPGEKPVGLVIVSLYTFERIRLITCRMQFCCMHSRIFWDPFGARDLGSVWRLLLAQAKVSLI